MQLFNKLSDFPSIDELETSFFWYAAVRNGSDNTIILVKTCFSTLSYLQCLIFITDCNSFWALSYARNKHSLRFRSTLALNVSELILFLRDNGRKVYYVTVIFLTDVTSCCRWYTLVVTMKCSAFEIYDYGFKHSFKLLHCSSLHETWAHAKSCWVMHFY